MRKIILFALLAIAQISYGQLSVNILIPPGGIMDKQQLWNIIATNTEAGPITIQAQVRFTETSSGQQVFVASTSPFELTRGTTQLSASSMGSIFYNVLSPDYRIDPGPQRTSPNRNIYCLL